MPIDPAALELAREILSKERCSKERDSDFDITPYFYDRLVPFAAALLEAGGEIERLRAEIVSVETTWSEACKAEARDCGCWGRIMDLRTKWKDSPDARE